jgi:hypothetical protein
VIGPLFRSADGLTIRPSAKTSEGSKRILLIPGLDMAYYVWRRGRLRQLRRRSVPVTTPSAVSCPGPAVKDHVRRLNSRDIRIYYREQLEPSWAQRRTAQFGTTVAG